MFCRQSLFGRIKHSFHSGKHFVKIDRFCEMRLKSGSYRPFAVAG